MFDVVHDGPFHADDVFAVAEVFLGGLTSNVVRSRDQNILAKAKRRIDVGCKNNHDTGDYDHHQEDGTGFRPNGVPYASFGLVHKHYGHIVCGSAQIADIVDRRLVQAIDAYDVGHDLYTGLKYPGVAPCVVADIINGFNPPWYQDHTPEDFDYQFFAAVHWAKTILQNAIVSARGASIALQIIRRALDSALHPNILVLDRHCDRRELILDDMPQVLFVVMPPEHGGQWIVRVVQECMGILKARRYLPQAWAGKKGAELKRLTGIKDARFCHNSCFIAGATSKEGALQMAMLALQL